MCFICVASVGLRSLIPPKILEDSAVGLMELVTFEGWFFQINSARTDFIDCETPQFSGRRRGSKEMLDG
jgi:hypothetical protein